MFCGNIASKCAFFAMHSCCFDHYAQQCLYFCLYTFLKLIHFVTGATYVIFYLSKHVSFSQIPVLLCLQTFIPIYLKKHFKISEYI